MSKSRTALFASYLKTAARSLLRDRFYSAFNIAGLAIGMACCLLAALFVIDEYRYDRHQSLSERIYRIVTPEGGVMPPPLGPMLYSLPEIEEVVRIHPGFKPMLVYGNRRSMEQVHFVDGDFPKVFDIEFIYGDPATALDGFRKMVLSQEVATRLFGDRDPRGEILSWDERYDYEITGVAKVPSYTHFRFDVLGSMESMTDDQFWNTHTNWSKEFRWFYPFTYIVLSEGGDPKIVPQKVYDLVGQTRGSDAQEIVENRGRFQLQRLHDIHLHSDFPHELQPNGHIEHVYIAVAVAALVLLIACINYVNLAIARGVRRAREIGIRKAIGAHRHQLVTQLLGESALTCLFALALAVGIAQLTLPSFNAFIDKNTSLLASSDLLLLAAGAAVVVGLIAGLYPAFVISARPPALALALFTSELRTREFAVRKVLGASDRQIASLLLISFTWPVLAALCAAWPAAYFAVRTWLESFTYRTAIDPFIFVASASAVLAVVWTTVGYQALRAARANPVDALRSE